MPGVKRGDRRPNLTTESRTFDIDMHFNKYH